MPAAAPPATHNPKTLWLDSTELEPITHNPKTLWLDSTELEPITHHPKTLWLDSNELTEVAPQPVPPAEPSPPATVAVKKGKLRGKGPGKARPLKNAQGRVTARKQRRAPLRKSSR